LKPSSTAKRRPTGPYTVTPGSDRSCRARGNLAAGLAWTPAGGELMFIEAQQMPGSGLGELPPPPPPPAATSARFDRESP
jgi:hypothetical protein